MVPKVAMSDTSNRKMKSAKRPGIHRAAVKIFCCQDGISAHNSRPKRTQNINELTQRQTEKASGKANVLFVLSLICMVCSVDSFMATISVGESGCRGGEAFACRVALVDPRETLMLEGRKALMWYCGAGCGGGG